MIPVVSGQNEESSWKICETGFGVVNLTDQGCYGKGFFCLLFLFLFSFSFPPSFPPFSSTERRRKKEEKEMEGPISQMTANMP